MKHPIKRSTPLFRRAEESGQSLVEYALIIVLVVLAFGFALAATGPAISRIFSNTVYNLLGEEPGGQREFAKDPVDFWLTVTWVAQNPLQERLIPTPTRVPPSLVPPADLTPRTPTPITPTPTIAPTRTPVPTATPQDVEFPYPYDNSANTTQLTDFRLGGAPFLGYADWYGRYYTGRNFGDANLAFQGYNEEIYGPGAKGVLDLPNAGYANWTNQNSGPKSGWPSSSANDNFSVKFTREIYVETTQTLRFFVNADDGVRVWILPTGQSADSCAVGAGLPNVISGGTATVTNRLYGDNAATAYGVPASFATGCLLVDDWQDQGFGGTGTVLRTVPAGTYTLQVDLYEAGGGAGVQLLISAVNNPYDTAVNSSGTPIPSGSIDCNWGAKTTTDANTLMNMWEEYVGGNIPSNMRCYLELRGFITVPTGATAPRLTFWDVWDLNHSSFSGWIEVAEYVPVVATNYAIDRVATTWYRIPIRQGATVNYNWTYTEIPLDNVNAFAPNGTATVLNFVGKRLTFRFVMQSSSTSGNTRRWYVDDIQVKNDLPTKNLTLGFYGDDANTSFFNFNTPTDRDYFMTTGQWDLTANNAVTDPDTSTNPTSCCSWELNPSANYNRFSESDGGSTATNQSRIHYIQFAAPVSQSLSTIDDEGDLGAPMLSFMSGYLVGSYTNIEVQYRAVNDTVWRVIPGDNVLNPGRPAGELHTGISSGSPSADRRALTPVDIDLSQVKDSGGIPIDTFYLRFAVIVRSNTDAQNTSNQRPGWWIDDIRLHRKGIDRFIDYPFYDGAEEGIENWLPSGQWWRVNTTKYQGGHAFTDSPGGSYANNTNFTMRLIKAIDFRNDTPDNLAATDRNPAGGNTDRNTSDGNPLATPAINPIMSFWHLRRLTNGDNIHVEWRNANETEGDWKRVWSYITRMTNNPNALNDKTRYNDAWEYVEIDLAPIVATFTANTKSDDILFRFRLFADNSNNEDGIYIDEIRIEDGTENVYRLWDSSTNPTINGVQFGNGTGANWASDADETNWFTKWRMGGEWKRIDWEQSNGLNSFHESAFEQTSAQYLTGDAANTTKIRSYQVLEMTQIIDMRATDRTTRPTLYFWSRFRTADDDRLTVQISYELRPSDYSPQTLNQHMTDRCRNSGVTQCYEQEYGWSPWTEQPNPSSTWSSTMAFNIGEYQNSFGWKLYQVDLSNYAAIVNAPQAEGRRIRIRFVFDALENGGSTTKAKYDGWYLDDLRIVPRYDQVVIADIDNDVFYDGAANLNNWITEGIWGLDPEVTASGGATVATLGIWREYWWNCDRCTNLAPGGTASNQQMLIGADIFLDNTNPTTHAVNLSAIGSPLPRVPVQRSVLDINYRMKNGTPRPGITTFTDNFVGRWVLDTPVIGPSSGVAPGQYTFITVSDNGVRMKIDQIDGSGNVIGSRPPALEWNVINNWWDHGEMTDMGIVTLQSGLRYRIVLEYYERGSNATLTLSLGGSTFSFTDSPKQGAGVGFPDIPALPNANTALILNGVLDLQGTTRPVLEYYTLYELDSDSDAIVEVSIDGGFTWQTDGLGDDIPLTPGGCGSGANSSTCDFYQGAQFDNSWRVPGNTWEIRRHNLSNYEGQLLMIRFRLRRSISQCMSYDNWTCTTTNSNYNQNNWFVSWWIVDITVAKTS